MKNHHVETECIPRERFSPLTLLGRSARRHINGSYECTAAIHLGIVGCGYGSYHLGATHGGKLSGIVSHSGRRTNDQHGFSRDVV
jgi:hypothetical protein